jgi:hypothetical protein
MARSLPPLCHLCHAAVQNAIRMHFLPRRHKERGGKIEGIKQSMSSKNEYHPKIIIRTNELFCKLEVGLN